LSEDEEFVDAVVIEEVDDEVQPVCCDDDEVVVIDDISERDVELEDFVERCMKEDIWGRKREATRRKVNILKYLHAKIYLTIFFGI
jgi:hypothetical protein